MYGSMRIAEGISVRITTPNDDRQLGRVPEQDQCVNGW